MFGIIQNILSWKSKITVCDSETTDIRHFRSPILSFYQSDNVTSCTVETHHGRFHVGFSIHIVTWNVNTKCPEGIDLNSILGLESNPENDKHQSDFYAIGLQEVKSKHHSIVCGISKEDPWTQKFKELLEIRGYIAIKSEHLQGLLIILFAKRQHLLHVHQVECGHTKTGCDGNWGNKGAVSIRFSLYGISVCIVNAHLAAHDHMMEERIKDYKKIVKELKFEIKRAENIFAHDYVFWFGDLNFRLTGEYSAKQIQNLVQTDKLNDLVTNDQLSLIKMQGRAFTELIEQTPAFPPTFKFEIGTSEYDMERRPAWTDRILYKEPMSIYENAKLSAKQTSYRSHPEYFLSDHKPVSCEFTIKVFKNSSEEFITFSPVNVWQIDEDNVIEYTLPVNYKEARCDWIGLFEDHFTSLDGDIAYVYTETKYTSGNANADKMIYHLKFPKSVELSEDKHYVLLYFQSAGTKGLTDLVGMSNAFKATRNISMDKSCRQNSNTHILN